MADKKMLVQVFFTFKVCSVLYIPNVRLGLIVSPLEFRENFLERTKQELSSCWDGRPFGRNRHGRKARAVVPLSVGELGPHIHNIARAEATSVPSGIVIHPAIWPQWPWAEKCGSAVLCRFPWGAGSPSKAMWPWPRPIFVPSGILIQPAVWPQQLHPHVTQRHLHTKWDLKGELNVNIKVVVRLFALCNN